MSEKKIPTSQLPGYAEGYRRGRARTEAELERDHQQFIQRRAEENLRETIIYAACLHAALVSQGWTIGGKPILDVDQRINLAGDFYKATRGKRP